MVLLLWYPFHLSKQPPGVLKLTRAPHTSTYAGQQPAASQANISSWYDLPNSSCAQQSPLSSRAFPSWTPQGRPQQSLPKLSLFHLDSTNPGLAWEPQSTLPKDSNKGPPAPSACTLPWPPEWPLEESMYLLQDLGLGNFSILTSPVDFCRLFNTQGST